MVSLPPGMQLVDRAAHQALQLGAARLRLVERGRERRALLREQRLAIEHVVAGRPAGVELLAADAEVLLRLPTATSAVLRRAASRSAADALGRARTACSSSRSSRSMRSAVLVGGEPRLRDARLAPGVGAEIPLEADEARADRARLDDVGGRVVDRAAGGEARQATAGERGRLRVEPLLLLDERGEHRVLAIRDAQRLGGVRQRRLGA